MRFLIFFCGLSLKSWALDFWGHYPELDEHEVEQKAKEFYQSNGRPYPFPRDKKISGLTVRTKSGAIIDHSCFVQGMKLQQTLKTTEEIRNRFEQIFDQTSRSLQECVSEYPQLRPFTRRLAEQLQQTPFVCEENNLNKDTAAWTSPNWSNIIHIGPILLKSILDNQSQSALEMQDNIIHELLHQIKGDNRCDHNEIERRRIFDKEDPQFCHKGITDDRVNMLSGLCSRFSVIPELKAEVLLSQRMKKCGGIDVCTKLFNQAGVVKGVLGSLYNIFSSYSLTLGNEEAMALCQKMAHNGRCLERRRKISTDGLSAKYLRSRPSFPIVQRDFFKAIRPLFEGDAVPPVFLQSFLGEKGQENLLKNSCYQQLILESKERLAERPTFSDSEDKLISLRSFWQVTLAQWMAKMATMTCSNPSEKTNLMISLKVLQDQFDLWDRNTGTYLSTINDLIYDKESIPLAYTLKAVQMARGNLAPSIPDFLASSLEKVLLRHHVESNQFDCETLGKEDFDFSSDFNLCQPSSSL